jgi:hypothetical protein
MVNTMERRTADMRTEGVDFWLGDRGEGKVTDFDGRLRACRVLKRIRFAGGSHASHLLVHVEPPLPLSSGTVTNHVVIGPRWTGRDLEDLPTELEDDDLSYLAVYIYEVLDDKALGDRVIEAAAVRPEWYGEIARRPDLLPSTQEDQFNITYQLLERFVRREGHADVPPDHVEEGVNLGVWVANLRFEQANLGLRHEWAARLAMLPGWSWLPGSDFWLLERYAHREGHTKIPEDYIEEGRPLGRWVGELRELHASGRLAKDWEERLGRIRGWAW